jgi:hypothetical protein
MGAPVMVGVASLRRAAVNFPFKKMSKAGSDTSLKSLFNFFEVIDLFPEFHLFLLFPSTQFLQVARSRENFLSFLCK